ncbi:MAG: VWA domain-containing protein [Anaerolineae bacterium]
MRALLRWGWLAATPALMALSVAAGSATVAHAQSSCTVTGERSFAFPESKPVQFGGEVDVTVSLILDCPGGTWPDALTISEGLTPELELVEGVGVTPTSRLGSEVAWRFEQLPPRGQALDVLYSLYVLPDPSRFGLTRTLEIDWPMAVEIEIGGASEQLQPPSVDPLAVAERPGARDCRRIVQDHAVEPGEVLQGRPFEVQLSLRFEACFAADQRHRAVIAVQPPPDYTTHNVMVPAVVSLLAAIDSHQPGARGMSGLYSNSSSSVVAIAPTVDRERIARSLARVPLGPLAGNDAAAAVRGASGLLADWTDHHEVVYYLTHPGAPRADIDEVRDALAEASSHGIEIVAVCIGAGGPGQDCDPALTYQHEPASWSELAAESGQLPKEHGGPPMAVRGIDVIEGIPGYLTVDDGTVAPPPTSVQHGEMEWRGLSAAVDEQLTFSYEARIQDWGRFPVGSGGRLTHEDADGRGLDTELLLPGFVTIQPDPGADGCRAAVAKSARPARVPVGEPVKVQLELTADCQQLHDRMHVVLTMDRSGSMTHGGAEYSYIKMAARSLAEMLAVGPGNERRFGLISHGLEPVVEVPLTNDLAEIASRIDAMTGKGQDNVPRSIAMAHEMLRAARPADTDRPMEVIVVLSDGGQNFPYDDVVAAGQAAKDDGVLLVSACSLTNNNQCDVMSEIAGDRQHYYEVDRIEQTLDMFVRLGMQLREVPLAEVIITDDLPDHVRLVPGSDHPPVSRIEGRRLVWEIDDVSEVGARPSYEIQPLLLGRQPTNTWAQATFRDERGRSGSRVFPVPEVETYLPDPRGPCDVVAAKWAAPLDPTVGESVTAQLTVSATCPRTDAPVDAVLVIDHSESMRSGNRLGLAIDAALAFIDALDPDRDRVGLVPFSTTVDEPVPLTHDFDLVRTGVFWLNPEGTTAIGAALRSAKLVMGARRTEAKALVVLLTDGRDPQPWIMLDQAQEMKDADVTIATFCAGECDPELAGVASRPELAVQVDDPLELVELYRALAEDFAIGYAHSAVVTEWLPPALEQVPGAVVPEAAEIGSENGDIVWRPGQLRSDILSLTYRVRPQSPGRLPVGRARLDYLYGSGSLLSGSVYFPIPMLDVSGGTAPTPVPTLTPTPSPTDVRPVTASPTVTATPNGTGVPPDGATRLYIPAASR